MVDLERDLRHIRNFRKIIFQHVIASRALGNNLFNASLVELLNIPLNEVKECLAIPKPDGRAATANLGVRKNPYIHSALLKHLRRIDYVMFQKGIEGGCAPCKKENIALLFIRILKVQPFSPLGFLGPRLFPGIVIIFYAG